MHLAGKAGLSGAIFVICLLMAGALEARATRSKGMMIQRLEMWHACFRARALRLNRLRLFVLWFKTFGFLSMKSTLYEDIFL